MSKLAECILPNNHNSVIQTSLDYLEHHRIEYEKSADGDSTNQLVDWNLVYRRIHEWITLESSFQHSHANDEPLAKLEDIESNAARLLLKRLAEGELGGINPIHFFESAVERLGEGNPQAILIEHVKSIVTAKEDSDSYEFNNTRWDYLQPRSRLAIWHVIVRGVLIHFAQRYRFTDIQDAGVKGIEL